MFGLSISRAADCRGFVGEATVEGQEGSTNKGRCDCGDNATFFATARLMSASIINVNKEKSRNPSDFHRAQRPNLSTMER
jgi:hypothetical protein